MTIYTCPNGCDLKAAPIPEKHFDPALHQEPGCSEAKERFGKCFCLPYGERPPEERFYSDVIGVETPGYDGISFWRCPRCGHEWPREFSTSTGLRTSP